MHLEAYEVGLRENVKAKKGETKKKRWTMPPFLYRCPNTGDNVQAWAADDPEDDDLTYVQVTCLACAQAHLVNPKSGRVLGAVDDE
jgi:hypothetical protein